MHNNNYLILGSTIYRKSIACESSPLSSHTVAESLLVCSSTQDVDTNPKCMQNSS